MTPRYDYRCPKCKAHEIIVHDFHATDTQECAMCGHAMHKVITAPAVHFKGSGFYRTDNANG